MYCKIYVGFVADKVALGQVFPEYFAFPPKNSLFTYLTILIYHPGLVQ
jgi:hypothetical protein